MKIGWWDHFEQLRGVPLAQQYDERLQLLQIADAAGFHGYHIAEHHLTPLDMAPSPLMFLTAAARVTEQIRLGTLVLVLPLYHPVRLLQELYMLDHLSHGRLMPGVGKGVRDVEHEWFGHDQSESRDRFDECLAILQSALATDRLDFHGAYFHYDDEPTNYTTIQKPMRFWYAGNVESALERGMNVIGFGPREAFDHYAAVWAQRQAAGDPAYQGEEPLAGSTRRVFIAPTDDAARVIAERAWAMHHENFVATSLRIGGKPGPPGYKGVPAADGGVVYGSPDTVRTALVDLLDQLGPNHNYFAPSFQWGDLSYSEASQSLGLFISEVMPALQSMHTPEPV
ncbi:MAG: LLM class flavin-dependent oxidoreductase [Acidimicrobiales bacterium]